MNRSLYYPLGRAADMDAGGAADLQTDIMRFMAILSLCLVAIFALVQSIPLNPVALEPPIASQAEPVVPEMGSDPFPQPSPETPQPTATSEKGSDPFSPPEATKAQPKIREITWRDLIPKPTPVAGKTPPESTQAPVPPAPPPEPAARELAEAPVPPDTPPAPAPSAPQPVETVADAPTRSANEVEPVENVTEAPANAPTDEGFTLRFESDTALTRLVARNEVGLYAIGQERSLRMSVNRGAVTFWPASAPNQFHEMDPGTVPADVVAALRRSGTLAPDPAPAPGPDPAGSGPYIPTIKWGVTLPTKMRRQLDGYLTEQSSGTLVIEGDGNLRLEP